MKKAIVVKYIVDIEDKTIVAKINVVNAPKREDNLKFFYSEIGCDMIDAVFFKGFDVFCDDEGLLKSGNAVIEYSQGENRVPLAGNLVFTNGIDKSGNTLWFEESNPDDIVTMEIIIKMIEAGVVRGVTQ